VAQASSWGTVVNESFRLLKESSSKVLAKVVLIRIYKSVT